MKPFMDSILDFESSDPSSTLGRQGQENRTCSFCLKTFFGITARRKHEENVHQGKVKGFKCDLCDKSYSNNNALSYHNNTKHEYIVSKFNCNVCGLKFSTERTLSKLLILQKNFRWMQHLTTERPWRLGSWNIMRPVLSTFVEDRRCQVQRDLQSRFWLIQEQLQLQLGPPRIRLLVKLHELGTTACTCWGWHFDRSFERQKLFCLFKEVNQANISLLALISHIMVQSISFLD